MRLTLHWALESREARRVMWPREPIPFALTFNLRLKYFSHFGWHLHFFYI